ncbi:uncharacterized protein KGF55_002862 [Candida pseudojiufengensis]|uniref:uncharacterized protein n=1 Tax=Candida pseudojiufengensis TaxID=497109 RepID=UPI00222561FA|nr:uncharacterized protein KGF55_002862 [Candida pseudojiufengensis]KAI5963070.1 hypothetical protein KGF55_002862 [Candida pseudojiufengensis]
MLKLIIIQLLLAIVYASSDLKDKWGSLWQFQGIATFAHLDQFQCLVEPNKDFDIGIIGVPFDTAVSYRPGARFGPRAIRDASQRQYSLRGYNQRAHFNPYQSWATINDCGDIPVTPMDNHLAFKQMDLAFEELLLSRNSAIDSKLPPRFIALGGDHSVLLPHIRALHKIYGRLNILHFDAHLDTWSPEKYPSYWRSDQNDLSHGSMLWQANEEGLTTKNNVHVGVRTRLTDIGDYEDDDSQNWLRIEADDIWLKGPQYVVDKILETIPKNTPTYISVDIDVLDPGNAPGTGTHEAGGFLPRELIHLLRSVDDLTIVGADVVEVAPAYDISEITALNAAQVVFELLTSMVKKGKLSRDLISKEVKVF